MISQNMFVCNEYWRYKYVVDDGGPTLSVWKYSFCRFFISTIQIILCHVEYCKSLAFYPFIDMETDIKVLSLNID